MAKRRQQQQTAGARADGPMTEQQLAEAGLNPFLKVDHLTEGAEAFTLTGWVRRKVGRFGEQIIIEVTSQRNSRTYDFGFGDGSPNHRKMFREMGRDEKQWAGVIVIEKKHNARSGSDMLHIAQVTPDEPPF